MQLDTGGEVEAAIKTCNQERTRVGMSLCLSMTLGGTNVGVGASLCLSGGDGARWEARSSTLERVSASVEVMVHARGLDRRRWSESRAQCW